MRERVNKKLLEKLIWGRGKVVIRLMKKFDLIYFLVINFLFLTSLFFLNIFEFGVIKVVRNLIKICNI